MKLSSTNSLFANEPSVRVPRSRFKVPVHSHKFTFNNGELIPFKVMEILPGDTVSFDLASVVRMNTPVKPVMDNVFMDIFFFFVPRRLTWIHWEEFMGANKSGPWTPTTSYNLPHTKAPAPNNSYPNPNGGPGYWYKPVSLTTLDAGSGGTGRFEGFRDRGVLAYKNGSYMNAVADNDSFDTSKSYYVLFKGWDVGSIANYMGMPLGTYCEIDSGYLRAYCLIWNEFFRDQNYMNYTDTEFTTDGDSQGVSRLGSSNYIQSPIHGGKPLQVARFHDYFSSVLPEPQFGDAVQIPFSGMAQVSSIVPSVDPSFLTPFRLYSSSGTVTQDVALGLKSGGSHVQGFSSPFTSVLSISSSLGADVQSVAGTITDLRHAFQIQKYLERSARYGNRYIEIINGQFGVTNPDYRLQRPELLASFRKIINVAQVLQTSSTDSVSPQGNTSAYSLTTDKRSCFTKSFTEHGILLGLCCTRTARSYQQGVPRSLTRRKKFDFYFPVFAHISEQPILNKEVFCHFDKNFFSNNPDNYSYWNGVFGYQEAWAEYRYMNSQISGEFASQSPTPLDFWHYADYYEQEVFASDEWLFEGPENLDRTLAVKSSICDQFYADFAFDITMVRPMPLYSIPGLADHF